MVNLDINRIVKKYQQLLSISDYKIDTTNLIPILIDDMKNILIDTIGIEKYTITQHNAGIRCVPYQQSSLVGTLPMHNRLVSFTGFGSKGFMTCPLHADRLIRDLG